MPKNLLRDLLINFLEPPKTQKVPFWGFLGVLAKSDFLAKIAKIGVFGGFGQNPQNRGFWGFGQKAQKSGFLRFLGFWKKGAKMAIFGPFFDPPKKPTWF